MGYDPVWKTVHCPEYATLDDVSDPCACTCDATFDPSYQDSGSGAPLGTDFALLPYHLHEEGYDFLYEEFFPAAHPDENLPPACECTAHADNWYGYCEC